MENCNIMGKAIKTQMKTSGFIFERELLERLSNDKTSTIRVWSKHDFDMLESAIKAGCVLPARGNWETEAVRGILWPWLLEKRALYTLTKEDLLYEGVPASTSVDDFLIKYCKGVPTDTACFSSSFIDDQGNSCEQEKVVFLMRFTYIDFSIPIPMLLNDLKMTWQLTNVADDVTDKCGSCMLKALVGDECTSSCTSCKRLVHCEPESPCAVKISGRFYCGPCSAIQALGLQQVSQYPTPLVNDSLIPDQVKWGNIVGLGGGPYRYKHSNHYDLY